MNSYRNRTVNWTFLLCLGLSAMCHLWVLMSDSLARLLSALPLNATDAVTAADRSVELELAPPETEEESKKAKPPEWKRFMETPEGPDEDEPEAADMIGARNMRARDRFEGDTEVNERPHMEGAEKEITSNLFTAAPPGVIIEEQFGAPREQPEAEAPDAAPAPPPAPAPSPALQDKEEGGLQTASDALVNEIKDAPAVAAESPKPPEPAQDTQELKSVPGPQALNVEGGHQGLVLLDEGGSNASKTGQESFNIKRHIYSPYYSHILERIGVSWHILGASEYLLNLKMGEQHKVVVEFEVARSGDIRNLKLAYDGGNLMLSARVLACVRAASPLNRFPGYISEEKLQIRFTFLF